MRKFFVIMNVVLIGIIAYLAFGPQDTLTGFAILEDGPQRIVLGAVLYYNLTDVETGKVADKEYITDKDILLVKEDDEVEDYSKLVVIEEWDIVGDADGEEERCENKSYVNVKYFYDVNGNGAKEKDDFELYGTHVDDKGCFKIRVPNDKFRILIKED